MSAPLVFITGASSGIGQALAGHYARAGWRLALVARRADVLADWARARQLDRLGGAACTDGLVRLFANRLPPLVVARGAGLALLDRLPLVKSFVARRMIFGARGG